MTRQWMMCHARVGTPPARLCCRRRAAPECLRSMIELPLGPSPPHSRTCTASVYVHLSKPAVMAPCSASRSLPARGLPVPPRSAAPPPAPFWPFSLARGTHWVRWPGRSPWSAQHDPHNAGGTPPLRYGLPHRVAAGPSIRPSPGELDKHCALLQVQRVATSASSAPWQRGRAPPSTQIRCVVSMSEGAPGSRAQLVATDDAVLPQRWSPPSPAPTVGSLSSSVAPAASHAAADGDLTCGDLRETRRRLHWSTDARSATGVVSTPLTTGGAAVNTSCVLRLVIPSDSNAVVMREANS